MNGCSPGMRIGFACNFIKVLFNKGYAYSVHDPSNFVKIICALWIQNFCSAVNIVSFVFLVACLVMFRYV